MPKRTEEQTNIQNSKSTKSKISSTSVEKKKTPHKKITSTKNATTSKKTIVSRKASEASKRKTNTNTTKASQANKISNKKASTNKSTTSKSKTSVQNNQPNLIEYYDLPYKYNKTIVKILAQTPHTLFVYWEISDEDRNKYIKEYGPDFFNKSIPVLIITNFTKNYSFEIQINDYANSWYFDVADEKCKYSVELGRRSISYEINVPNNYLYVASSNKIESPNGHILFDELQKVIYFRDTKTGYTFKKDIAHMQFMKYLNKVYNVYSIKNIYKRLYKDENIFDINNPTSNFGNP